MKDKELREELRRRHNNKVVSWFIVLSVFYIYVYCLITVILTNSSMKANGNIFAMALGLIMVLGVFGLIGFEMGQAYIDRFYEVGEI